MSKHEQPAALTALAREKSRVSALNSRIHRISKTIEGEVSISYDVKDTPFISAIRVAKPGVSKWGGG
jgi:hypothetical protein